MLLLLIQLAIVIAAARLTGWVFRRIGQPQVVGEMVAGLLLGPSVLGAFAPGLEQALFPPDSLAFLTALSQVGLVLFMFLIGAEFDPELLRGKQKAAILISQFSMVIPFALGVLLALWFHDVYAPANVPFTHFALFLGAALSVTAFPVLARILGEKQLIGTRLGAIALAAAAAADVIAWIVLTIVVTVARASHTALPLWATIIGALAFAVFMLFGVRRILPGLLQKRLPSGIESHNAMAVLLLLMLGSAAVTEWLGIHALIGAFLAGVVLPNKGALVQTLTRRLEALTVVFLLPIFFMLTGIQTRINFGDRSFWVPALIVLTIAILGKLGSATVGGRLAGLHWRDAAGIGALMNTRGLMELVILDIGLSIGVITPSLYAILVFMAIFTTVMTTPLLAWIAPDRDAPLLH